MTLLHHVMDAATAAKTVEADRNVADFRATSSNTPSARIARDQKAAAASAEEEARGAGLVSFGMLVTATTLNADESADVTAIIDNLSATARLALRPTSRRSARQRVRRGAAARSSSRAISASPRKCGGRCDRRAQARTGAADADAAAPGARGWPGRGGGSSANLQPADEWRGTTVQVCGLWPFASDGRRPTIGVPLGRNLLTGATVCCDPIHGLFRTPSSSSTRRCSCWADRIREIERWCGG